MGAAEGPFYGHFLSKIAPKHALMVFKGALRTA